MPASEPLETPAGPVPGRIHRLATTTASGLDALQGPAAFLLRVLRTPAAVKAIVSASAVCLFFAAVCGAENELRTLEAFEVDPGFMKIREMPPWLDENWAETIPNPFEGRRSVNLFEPGLTEKIHDAFSASPWIEEVSQVRKEFPNRLKIKLRIRTPLAAIPWGDEYLLVDGHGVLLPRRWASVPRFDFPVRVVQGVRRVPPSPGEVWASPGLEAGLRVAALLTGSKKKIFERVTRIDVSLLREDGRSGRTEILLYTAEGGGHIEWGAGPGRRSAVDLPVERKLENLEAVLRNCLDMREVRYATIQFDEPTYAPR